MATRSTKTAAAQTEAESTAPEATEPTGAETVEPTTEGTGDTDTQSTTVTEANGAPADPNAPGAVAVANGEQPLEPGFEDRPGINGVADPEIINKEKAPGVPGAPLDAPAAVRTGNLEQRGVDAGTVGVVGATMAARGNQLLDAATGEAPDADAMFENEVGGVYVSTVRLVESVELGNGSTTTRLVLPAGQRVSAGTAQRFIAAVKGQG